MSDNKKLTQEEFQKQTGNLAQVLDRMRDLGFSGIARIERARGAGLVREVARRKARSGATESETVAEAARVGAQVERNARVAAVRRAVEISQDVKSDLRRVTGRVLDERGLPVVRVKVVISKDDALEKPLETDLTDRSGTYLVEVTRSQYAAYFRGAKEFVVTALDQAGKPLREIRQPIPEKDTPVRIVNLSLKAAPKPDLPSGPSGPARPTGVDLSAVPGLGRARLAKLKDENVVGVADLVGLAPKRLAEVIGVNEDAAKEILGAAKALLNT